MPVRRWLTHTFWVPDVVLSMVGLVALPVPAVASVCHNTSFVPVPVGSGHTGEVLFSQKSAGLLVVGAKGLAITSKLKAVLGLSHDGLLVVWLTHISLVPDVVVIAGGLVAPIPPVAPVYHNKLFPVPAVAVHTGAVPPSQKSEGDGALGALGVEVTSTCTVASV